MLTWSDNYIMGIDQFDQEHQQLFRLAEQNAVTRQTCACLSSGRL